MEERKGYIPQEVIYDVLAATDIVDIISPHVPLKKKGASYMGLCPFHKEKTPSFSVNPERNGYHCFGCGAGGNAISFLMEYENKPFRQALQELADRAGIILPQTGTEEEQERLRLRGRILEMNRASMEIFCQQDPEGDLFDKETVEAFQIGAPSLSWKAQMRAKGFSESELRSCGLWNWSPTGRSGCVLDDCRYILPIMNRKDVIGFAGIREDGSVVTSGDTDVFRSDRALYGLGHLDYRKDFMVLVGSIQEVVRLQKEGVPAVCSPDGGLTGRQAALIRRYVRKVLVCGESTSSCRRKVKQLQEESPYEEGSSLKKAPFVIRACSRYGEPSMDGILYLAKTRKGNRGLEDAAEALRQIKPGIRRDNYVHFIARQLEIEPEALEELIEAPGGKETG